MGRFKNIATGSIVSVDDEKDHRFTSGWEPVEEKTPAKPRVKKQD